ncbi:hypothetical protein [Methylobacterium longum]|uniref:Uncharacterized protein n=1 Tax=Methylobacterium longum TaxID=767694 RepID=A0ABT8B013_9HYPH|nr:hypothetical protein [Methylobacterium longum]MDN3574859.1 hypothetical protein [Methylobacterium longum]
MTGHPCNFAHAIGYAAPVAEPATAQTGAADAELLRLGEKLERLWSAETDLSLHSRRNSSDAADDAIDAAVNGTSASVDKYAHHGRCHGRPEADQGAHAIGGSEHPRPPKQLEGHTRRRAWKIDQSR